MKRGRRWGALPAAIFSACLMGGTALTASARELPDADTDTEGAIVVVVWLIAAVILAVLLIAVMVRGSRKRK